MASPNKKTRYDFKKDINEIIQKELWSDLSTLLQDGGLSDAEQCGAVEAASKHCAESIFLSLISPHCTSSQLHSALPHLASRGLWRAVGHVLQRGVSTALLAWSVKQAVLQCTEQELLSFILPHCAEDQLDSVLAVLVKRGLWSAVGVVIKHVQGSTRSWAIEKACQEAGEHELVVYILPACSAVEIECALAQIVARRLWFAVGEMLQRGVSDTLYMWTLQEAFTQTECELIRNRNHILPHCTRLYLNRGMSYLISAGRWNDVEKLLQCVGENMSTWSVDKLNVISELSLEVRGAEIDKQMLQLVAKGRWQDVGAMFAKGVGDSQQEWLVLTACLQADEEDFVQHVLPHCSDRLLDSVLTVMVVRRAWMAVVQVFRRPVSDSKKQWAVLEACKHCEEDANHRFEEWGFYDVKNLFGEEILPHCADNMLDSVLTTLAERHLWLSAVSVLNLERGVSDFTKRWVLQKAQEDIENGRFDEDFNEEDGSFINIVHHFADDQMDDVLTALVEGQEWYNVGEALQREVSDSVKRFAVEEVCAHYENYDDDDESYDDGGTPDPDESGDSLSSIFSSGIGLTGFVPNLAARKREPVFNDKRTCHSCNGKGLYLEDDFEEDEYDDDYIIDNILPHCADDQLNIVLTTLVRNNKWMAVGEVMKRGVSDSMELWVVQKACRACAKCNSDKDYEYVLGSILPHCTHRQLNCLLTTLVPKHDWRAVGRVFKQDVAETMKQWVVKEVCKLCTQVDADEDVQELLTDSILPVCSDEQLSSLLRTLAERRLWRAVAQALLRNVSDSDKHVAVEEACKNYVGKKCCACGTGKESDDFILEDILTHCADAHLQSVLTTLAERNLFKSVKYVLKREVGDTELCEKLHSVFMHANESLIETVLSCYVYDDIHSELKTLASRRFWKVFLMLLHRFTIDTLCSWVIVEDGSETKERVFWDMVSNPCNGVKELSPAQWRSVTWSSLQHSLKDCLHWNTLLCEVLCEALLATVREIWLSEREKEVDCRLHIASEKARSITEDIHQHLNKTLIDCKSSNVIALLPCINQLCKKYADPAENSSFCTPYMSKHPIAAKEEEDPNGENGSSSSPLFQLHFLKYLTREYYRRKAWTQMTDAVLVVLTTTPVVPGVQSVALKIMVREKRWDIIRHACLSCVCEQDRRQVFQAAVKQRQWGAVKRWADYSLYDDQRLWALGEAKEEKRWDVYLKLAGHGLREGERMGVLYRVAMHADWKLVRHMVDTVADVSHMKDLLTNTRTSRQPRTKPVVWFQRIEQLTEFEAALKKDTNTLKTLKTAAKRGKWQVVLYNIRHKPDLQNTRLALKAAVSSEAWQTVIQLVRLETDVTRRDSLFRDMVRQQQWAVCRELLDQGVSDDLCVEALVDLMENRQWTLVAMVMRCPMSEERRSEMMYRALMMREGSVVWQCINSLQHPLSSEQRENIFQLAFKREVWQAVKPLVEQKDETGIRHRDTALLEAIEQHQWDVVDHCQRHHADINMKDDNGHTPIHRAARKGDWEAVKELTVRDGDPNLLDSQGRSVLHRAITAKEWDVVKLLIQFHGDIHLPSRHDLNKTSLSMLIDARQMDVIQSTFMWCADQWKGVNDKGETTLHAACLSGCPDILDDLIARRVDPLAVTSKGLSALCYAVRCRDCPQKMVAECIKLGFSTHQPNITSDIERYSSKSYIYETEMQKMLTSPMMLAVMRGLPVVTQMLFESGACSDRQLFNISAYLDSLTPTVPTTRLALGSELREMWRQVHRNDDSDCVPDTVLIKKSADNLRQMSSTPRSLVSTCRLVISRCLTLSKTRHRDIALLTLSPMLKNYLMFTDLTDEGYMGRSLDKVATSVT